MSSRWTSKNLKEVLEKNQEKKSPLSFAGLDPVRYGYYIGIDCGVNTGIAIWNKKEKQFMCISTVMIHQAMRQVEEWFKIFRDQGVLVRVEDARLRKMFGKTDREVLQGAGSVKRDAKIWEDFLTELGVPFEMVAPKNGRTKMDAGNFKKVTQCQKITSVHARDAGMLVFGF